MNVGFNIEVKYPNVNECEEFQLVDADLNVFVDAVLSCVYNFGGSRSIIFSSFHPETCLMLNAKVLNHFFSIS